MSAEGNYGLSSSFAYGMMLIEYIHIVILMARVHISFYIAMNFTYRKPS